MAEKVVIQDYGNGRCKILLNDKDVTYGCIYYKIEHRYDTVLPVLTLQYCINELILDDLCIVKGDEMEEK